MRQVQQSLESRQPSFLPNGISYPDAPFRAIGSRTLRAIMYWSRSGGGRLNPQEKFSPVHPKQHEPHDEQDTRSLKQRFIGSAQLHKWVAPKVRGQTLENE